MKDTLIIGSEGYIGKALYSYLKNRSEGVDITGSPDIIMNYSKIKKSTIKKYKNIVLLAANSSTQQCQGEAKNSLENNIVNFVNLLSKIGKKQKFIYASSASIYGNTCNKSMDENYNTFKAINYYDLTKYAADCYAQLSNVQYYGLRFGTVSGCLDNSLLIRDDTVINSMTKNALQNKKIKCINGDVHRALLGIGDLCKAIEAIIDGKDNRGIYNLASFNSSVKDIANFISNKYKCEVELIENDNQRTYDFMINCDKFKKVYKFNFSDTLDNITEGISKNIDSLNFVRRTECIKY